VSAGVEVTLPVQVLGSPLPGVGDPKIGPSVSISSRQGRHMHVVKEEIFAVAYDEVKTSYILDRSARKLKKMPVLGRAIRPSGRQLAFRQDSDSSDSSDSSDDEEDGAKLDDSHTIEVVLVDEGDFEEDEFFARSSYFDCDVGDRDGGES
jgi:hypothetical protein